MRPAASRSSERGFTLLEIMIVVSILSIIASIGVPQYVSALRTARVGKAKHELVTISQLVDSFTYNNGGQLPLTLHQVGFGGRRDPWGLPYCYLNYADGTGDGLHWAIEAGLVDPSAVQGFTPSGGGAPAASPGPAMRGGSFLPIRTRRAPQGLEDIGGADLGSRRLAGKALATTIAEAVPREVTPNEVDDLASAIVSSTAFSMFSGIASDATRRRDRYMLPLNTDYDLFSLGPNGRTTVSLGEALGQDDVIRANNGAFFGVAADY